MFFIGRGDLRSPAGVHRTPLRCGGSNLSTVLLLWGIYIKKCISLVQICLQTRNDAQSAEMHLQNSEKLQSRKKRRKIMPLDFQIRVADLKCHTLAAASRAGVALRGDNAPASRACGTGPPRRTTPANTKGHASACPFVL